MQLGAIAFVSALIVFVPAAVGPQRASASAAPTLFGSVGPGFVISFLDAGSNPVTSLAPGTYEIAVTDNETMHTFHLLGAGVNMQTGVAATPGTVTWTVTFQGGST